MKNKEHQNIDECFEKEFENVDLYFLKDSCCVAVCYDPRKDKIHLRFKSIPNNASLVFTNYFSFPGEEKIEVIKLINLAINNGLDSNYFYDLCDKRRQKT